MTTWRVGFMAAKEDCSWWQRWLLKPGYAHCWAAKWIDANLWMWVEWTPAQVLFGFASDRMVEAVQAAAHEVLEWQPAEPAIHPRRPLLALHHCASLVSHTIGLRPRPLATPWWLACALRRRGATRLMRPSAGATP